MFKYTCPREKEQNEKESKRRFKRLIKHCTAKSSTASIKREHFHELSFTEMSVNSQLEEHQGVPVSLALFELITAKVSMETKAPVWPVLSESQKDGKINCGGKRFYTTLCVIVSLKGLQGENLRICSLHSLLSNILEP